MALGSLSAGLKNDEYWRMFHVIRSDIDAAIRSHHVYVTINNLVAADAEVDEKVNRFPQFWKLNAYALQTTFFIAFGRLFDERRDAYSAQKLADATISNPGLFSKTALRERKRKIGNIDGPDPPWLVKYLRNAYEPSTADLMTLKAELSPHHEKFKAIYKPIRHKVYAHRSMEDEEAINELFGKTLVGDIVNILRFLHTFVWAVNELAWNGKKPDLGDFIDYDHSVRRIVHSTETFIRQLP